MLPVPTNTLPLAASGHWASGHLTFKSSDHSSLCALAHEKRGTDNETPQVRLCRHTRVHRLTVRCQDSPHTTTPVPQHTLGKPPGPRPSNCRLIQLEQHTGLKRFQKSRSRHTNQDWCRELAVRSDNAWKSQNSLG